MSNSKEHQLTSEMRAYIRALKPMPEACEECLVKGKKLDIHHTKYDGATLADLMWVCRRCNTQPHNRYLV